MGHESDNHRGRSYKIRAMKDKEICKSHPHITEDYLRNGMLKANRPQADNKLNELIDCSALMNQHEHWNTLEMEVKDIMSKTTQPLNYTKNRSPRRKHPKWQ